VVFLVVEELLVLVELVLEVVVPFVVPVESFFVPFVGEVMLVEDVVDIVSSMPVVPRSIFVVPSISVELSISVVELVSDFEEESSLADVVLVKAKIAMEAITHPEIIKYFTFIFQFV
jgi:hypothetical protein